jgi:hypothetical protein
VIQFKAHVNGSYFISIDSVRRGQGDVVEQTIIRIEWLEESKGVWRRRPMEQRPTSRSRYYL